RPGALQRLQHLQRLGIERFAGRREARGIRAAIHQVGASPRFQRLDPPRERRLGDVAQLRRAAETAGFSQADEVLQPFGFHGRDYCARSSRSIIAAAAYGDDALRTYFPISFFRHCPAGAPFAPIAGKSMKSSAAFTSFLTIDTDFSSPT